MIALMIGIILLYLLIGGVTAARSIPALWAREERLHDRDSYYFGECSRSIVVIGVIARALAWPVMGPYELLARQIDAQDPREVERRQREMKDRIAELERELGIGDR